MKCTVFDSTGLFSISEKVNNRCPIASDGLEEGVLEKLWNYCAMVVKQHLECAVRCCDNCPFSILSRMSFIF